MINKGIRERRERHLATKATKATKGAFINKGGRCFGILSMKNLYFLKCAKNFFRPFSHPYFLRFP